MDISADLTELGHTPVAVVSAGVKSILDIGRTLEYLETQGVAVVTYGEQCDFPAFFSQSSGFQVYFRFFVALRPLLIAILESPLHKLTTPRCGNALYVRAKPSALSCFAESALRCI